MPNIGPLELVIVLVIILLIFGPKRLPGLGKQLGSGMRDFKDAVTGGDKDDDDEDRRALDAGEPATRRTDDGAGVTTARVAEREPAERERSSS